MTYDYNEWLKNPIKIFCKCGCGQEIIIKKDHKWVNIPEYIRGHNSRDRIHDEETKQKIRKSLIGKNKQPKSEEHKQKMKDNHPDCFGENNSFYGKRHTNEYKQKSKDRMLGKYSQEKHWNWKGGITDIPYCERWTEKLRERIRERDGRICQNCEKTKLENNNRKLSVHHIHYDKENCYPDLISLCCSCNSIVNSNRDYWEEHFMKILKYRDLL